jgi:4-amino-4-deoxy-L-arabinose transferase-like glycosyltransferase
MGIGLVVRLIILPFSQTIDADAVTRIFMAYKWLKDPTLITSAVWLPLHLYFNAAVIWLSSGDLVFGPKLMNILFAVATVPPLYKFVKNEFNSEGAFWVSLTYLFVPIVIRNSLQALSGIPYAFFIVLAMYFLSQGRKTQQQIKYGILAGLAITLAGGFRYEAWLLIAVFTAVLFFQKQWKMMIAFMIFSMIVPGFWMVGCYIDKGDIFYGPNGAYRWNVVISGVNDHMTLEKYIRRTFFFFISWFFLLTPVVSFLIVFFTIKSRKLKSISRNTWLWLIPFGVLFLMFIYKAINGTLLLQHRFTLSLILTSLPFYALLFQDGKSLKTKRIIALSVVILFIPYSFLNRDIYSIPLLKDQGIVDVVEMINTQTEDPQHEGLVIDFIGWENTYYLSLKSDIIPENIFRVNGAAHGKVYLKYLKDVLVNNPDGFLLKRQKKSKLDQHLTQINDSLIGIEKTNIQLQLKEIYTDKKMRIYRYKVGVKE